MSTVDNSSFAPRELPRPDPNPTRRYLGDMVWVEYSSGIVTLTVEGGIRKETIYLDSQVAAALVKYITAGSDGKEGQ